MRLSQLKHTASIDVVRDGEFRSLGLLSHHADRMLVSLYDAEYLDRLATNSKIACVITDESQVARIPERLGVAVGDDPEAAFYRIHEHLLRETGFYGVDSDSEISLDAVVHERAYVAPKNVRIDSGAIIEPNATVLPGSVIGPNAVVRAGAVIGGEDLERKVVAGRHVVIPHAGGVKLCAGVEIQGNAQVQRSLFGGFTVVGEDTKIGALVHVAHHARVGHRCFVAPCVFVGGSTEIGDDVWIGPNATIASELRIGEGAVVTLGSVVTRDVPAGGRVSGNFAIEHSRFVSFIKGIR